MFEKIERLIFGKANYFSAGSDELSTTEHDTLNDDVPVKLIEIQVDGH